MGTFHEDAGDLHGITVVVETSRDRIYVGRCHERTDLGIVLLDADEREYGASARSKQDYLSRAARFGVFARHRRILVPRAEIRSVRRLGEIEVAQA